MHFSGEKKKKARKNRLFSLFNALNVHFLVFNDGIVRASASASAATNA